MRRSLPIRIARLAGRVTLALVAACVLGVVAIQFEGIVAKNVALAHEVSQSQGAIAALRLRAAHQRATIERLGDARGAVPEIHEKLGLVAPHEEILYVRATPPPAAEPANVDGNR